MCFAVAVGFVWNLVDTIFSFKFVRSLWSKAHIGAMMTVYRN